jgi:hypothetical protein
MDIIRITIIIIIGLVGLFMVLKHYKKGLTAPPVLSGSLFILISLLFFL